MKDVTITDNIIYIGADDKDLDLFESQYVIPNGVSYNSYVILDEKTAVMDTVDARRKDEWLENLEKALAGRTVDYLVVSHMEPDHAANVKILAEKYPDMKLCTDRIARGEDSALARETTLDLLKTYSDLNCFICFGSQGPIGAAEALTEEDMIGKATVVGNIIPSEGAAHLESGAITTGYLWNPADSGYASCYIAEELLKGNKIDSSFSIPDMGDVAIEDTTLWIDNPITITADNWKEFGF